MAEETKGRPRKRDFRTRAHRNPLSDANFPFPLTPRHVDWEKQYNKVPANTDESPLDFNTVRDTSDKRVTMVDIGCGYGGLIFGLADLFPNDWILGMEIRDKVVNYVSEKILALRKETSGKYDKTSVIRSNAMKHLPNFFEKGQLRKMFFCFADPHFKKSNHRRRIINRSLLTEYVYLLSEGGRIYSITDVKDLHDWNYTYLSQHSMLQEVNDDDPCIHLMQTATEESQKVTRNCGQMYSCVFERKPSEKN